ncbi:MAG: GNAT family N-acetyltransferase [Clostridiales bacterium]|nr:GNAT family N-acetyltransferase [Clostridiales bacterium]
MMLMTTENLIIEDFKIKDLDDLYKIYTDVETMKYIPYTKSKKDELFALANHIKIYYAEHGFGLWAIRMKETNELIGRCGLLSLKSDNLKEVELAYLIKKEYWGNGFASEASAAISEYAFEKLKMEKVLMFIDAENKASIRVAEKLGATYKGLENYKGKVALMFEIKKTCQN